MAQHIAWPWGYMMDRGGVQCGGTNKATQSKTGEQQRIRCWDRSSHRSIQHEVIKSCMGIFTPVLIGLVEVDGDDLPFVHANLRVHPCHSSRPAYLVRVLLPSCHLHVLDVLPPSILPIRVRLVQDGRFDSPLLQPF